MKIRFRIDKKKDILRHFVLFNQPTHVLKGIWLLNKISDGELLYYSIIKRR